MAGLGLPLPERIREALQPNQAAIDDGHIEFPSIVQLAEVRQPAPAAVAARLEGAAPPLILDLREPEEWHQEGRIAGARGVPLRRVRCLPWPRQGCR